MREVNQLVIANLNLNQFTMYQCLDMFSPGMGSGEADVAEGAMSSSAKKYLKCLRQFERMYS